MGLAPGLAVGLFGRTRRGGGYQSVWDTITTGTPYLAYDVNVASRCTVSEGALTECRPYLGGSPANDPLVQWGGYAVPTFNETDARFGGLSSCSRVSGVGTLRSAVPESGTLASSAYWLFVIGVQPSASTRWMGSGTNTAGENTFTERSSTSLRANAGSYLTLATADATQGVLLALKVNGASTTGFIRKASGTETSISGDPGTNGWRGFMLFASVSGPGTGNATAMAWATYHNDVSDDDITALRTWCQTKMGWA